MDMTPTRTCIAALLFLNVILALPLGATVVELPTGRAQYDRHYVRANRTVIHSWKPNAQATWKFQVEEPSEYRLVFSYGAETEPICHVGIRVDGKDVGQMRLEPTGGEKVYEHAVFDRALPLDAGEHTITLYSVDPEQEPPRQYPVQFKDLRLTGGYTGDYGFIETGLPLNSAATQKAWIRAMSESRTLGVDDAGRFAERMWTAFPLFCDWFLQDNAAHGEWGETPGYDARGDFRRYLDRPAGDASIERQLAHKVAGELGLGLEVPDTAEAALSRYVALCMQRRAARLAPLRRHTDRLVYALHHKMGTNYLSTAHQGCPDGSKLRMIALQDDGMLQDEVLYDTNNGIVRDPDVSWDGRRVAFASRPENGSYGQRSNFSPEDRRYKIYEMDLATRQVRPLTDHSTYGSDYEPCYLPNGDIMFTSQRCVQEVTCGWGDACNMYVMDGDGRYARRVGFDQTETGFPAVLPDGRVAYTRRDYNDRGQTWGHGLFTMNPDGTKQTEYYGNQSFHPTSLQHTRPIPGTSKTMSIAGGYHFSQGGKLAIVDPSRGQQQYRGLEFPFWNPEETRTGGDDYGREGDQYAYPYPFDDKHFLVSYAPIGGYLMSASGRLDRRIDRDTHVMRYKLYFMHMDGSRELLAAHPTLNCAHAVPVMARPKPTQGASVVDYTKDSGVMYVQDVYFGQGTEGVERGTVEKIRVVQLHYKPVTIGGAVWNPPFSEQGPGNQHAGWGHSVTPVGVGSASFDAKTILGEADVHEDGSAMFQVPARTSLYLQLIDKQGHAVQSMRSWATLMPGEKFSCVGCHEQKDAAPLSTPALTAAMGRKPQRLQPLHEASGRPFSYAKMVQPILNEHCVKCHAPGKKAAKIDLTDNEVPDGTKARSMNTTFRRFYRSYLTLLKADEPREGPGTPLVPGRPNKWVDYYTRLLTVAQVPPYYAGSANSGLLKILRKGHNDVKLSRAELDTIAAWMDLNVPFIGEYDAMNIWNDEQKKYFDEKMELRRRMEAIEQENIQEFIRAGQPY